MLAHSYYQTSKMPEKKKAGRPRRVTPLRQWIESTNQDPAQLAQELSISLRTLEDLMGGRKIPLHIAIKIKRLSAGALDLDALLDPSA